jgi:hypothetical protein
LRTEEQAKQDTSRKQVSFLPGSLFNLDDGGDMLIRNVGRQKASSSGLVFGLLFNPDHWGDMFLRNVDRQKASCSGFFFGLLFNPHDGGDIFLRNVGRQQASLWFLA